MSLLVVEGLSKSFGGVKAAQSVSFAVAAGEAVAVIGPNGAGKSTVFNMIGGEIAPDAGRVLFDGAEITGMPPRAVARAGIARTFQVAESFASMSVAENVQTAILARERRTWRFWRPARLQHEDEALDLLARVGMADQAGRACGVLAYGDVKRVELAMALAARPRLLLMDEPTAGMAGGERQDLMNLVAGLAGTGGIGVLFTEHDMDAVFAHARRIVVLDHGRIIAEGTPHEVRADPEVRRVYLGE